MLYGSIGAHGGGEDIRREMSPLSMILTGTGLLLWEGLPWIVVVLACLAPLGFLGRPRVVEDELKPRSGMVTSRTNKRWPRSVLRQGRPPQTMTFAEPIERSKHAMQDQVSGVRKSDTRGRGAKAACDNLEQVGYTTQMVLKAMAVRKVATIQRDLLNPMEIQGHSQVGRSAIDTLRNLNVQLDANLWQGMVRAQAVAARSVCGEVDPEKLSWESVASTLMVLRNVCVFPTTTESWIRRAVLNSKLCRSGVDIDLWARGGERAAAYAIRLSQYFSQGESGLHQVSMVLQLCPGIAALVVAHFLKGVVGPDDEADETRYNALALDEAITQSLTRAEERSTEQQPHRRSNGWTKHRVELDPRSTQSGRTRMVSELMESSWRTESSFSPRARSGWKGKDMIDFWENPMISFFWLASEALGVGLTLLTPDRCEPGLLVVNTISPLREGVGRTDIVRFAILKQSSAHFTAASCPSIHKLQGQHRHVAINSGMMGSRYEPGAEGMVQALRRRGGIIQGLMGKSTGVCIGHLGHEDQWFPAGNREWKVIGPDPEAGACWAPGLAMASGVSAPVTEWLRLMDRPCTESSTKNAPLSNLVNVITLIAKQRRGRVLMTQCAKGTRTRTLRKLIDRIEVGAGATSRPEDRVDFFFSEKHCLIHKPFLDAEGSRASMILDSVLVGKAGANLVIRATKPLRRGFCLPIVPMVAISLIFDEVERAPCTMEELHTEKRRISFPVGGHFSTVLPARVGGWDSALGMSSDDDSRVLLNRDENIDLKTSTGHGWMHMDIGLHQEEHFSIGNANLGGSS